MTPEEDRDHDDAGMLIDAGTGIGIGLILGGLLMCAIVGLFGCSSMLKEIPGRTKIGDCPTGPVYVYKDELICDDWRQTSFHAYKWKTLDLPSACRECRGWAW